MIDVLNDSSSIINIIHKCIKI